MNEFTSAGTTFTINGTQIFGLKTFPRMNDPKEEVDVTTTDDTENRRKIFTLRPGSTKEFGFLNQTENLALAKSFEKNKSNDCKLTLPDGSSYAWSGQITADVDSGNVGDPIAFYIACAINSTMVFTPGTVIETE